MGFKANYITGSNIVYCDDTQDLGIGLKLETQAVSNYSIITKIIDNEAFEISGFAISTGEHNTEIEKISLYEIWEIQAKDALINAGLNYGVELFPDNPEEYKLDHPNGVVLIRYNGSSYGEYGQGAAGMLQQEQFALLQIYVMGRSERKNKGLLNVIEIIRKIITNQIGMYCTQSWKINSESFIGEFNGEWHYDLSFQTKTIHHKGC